MRTARERCWRYNWVLDLDIKGFFDSIDWELMLTSCPSSYGLSVGVALHQALAEGAGADGGRQCCAAHGGNATGRVISPLLANLFLHYTFDAWMARAFAHIPFERYADDIICHCKSAEEARALWGAIADRFAVCKLVLHPQKTKIIYCKDANRRGDFPNIHFDFLGFQFRARKIMWVKRDRRIFRAQFPTRRQPKGV